MNGEIFREQSEACQKIWSPFLNSNFNYCGENQLGYFTSKPFNNYQRSRDSDLYRFSEDVVVNFHGIFSNVIQAWMATLENHCEETEFMFGKAETPWDRQKHGSGKREERGSERTLISTLVTAIARYDPQALIIEELPIPKGISDGRSDLWCSFPRKYSFYLEAKMTNSSRDTLEKLIKIFFKDKNKNSMMSRTFRDFQKSHGKLDDDSRRIVATTPYSSIARRQHPHDVVALTVGTFRTSELTFDVDALACEVEENFKSNQTIHIHKNIGSLNRNLSRLPTTGIVAKFCGKDGGENGLIAAFSLMGTYQKESK